MYFEREEMRENMVNLVIGIIDDYSHDEAQMKEELGVLLDNDEAGLFLEPKMYFAIVKRVDNSNVHRFFLEHIRSNAPEILQQILNQKPELI